MATDPNAPDYTCTARRHGTRAAYSHHGCRCPEALDAMRTYEAARRPVGTRRGPRSRDPHPDLIAVERACNGDRTVYLTVLELGLAIATLGRRGYSAKATARRLGVSDRTVTRHRAGLVRHGPNWHTPAAGSNQTSATREAA